ncbi:mitochondrial translation release factor in rescue [Halyomorpha halys]|uniref:mitochondrial translation release factor in rescue n=1 Tax=Halyomorpha halys TaxID=286706 RepID=UPI0006D4E890|nr:probable peptide chain release factor C12orf65 homolog, mitochondrial [Halyomorpha halys]
MIRLIRTISTRSVLYAKGTIDRSRVPAVNEEDLEEMFVKGHGPGGSAVNTTSNCVVLKHRPTGIVVKCHSSRWLDVNRKTARELLLTKLDNMINGEMSVENQMKSLEEKKSSNMDRKKRKLRELKEKWKERENIK